MIIAFDLLIVVLLITGVYFSIISIRARRHLYDQIKILSTALESNTNKLVDQIIKWDNKSQPKTEWFPEAIYWLSAYTKRELVSQLATKRHHDDCWDKLLDTGLECTPIEEGFPDIWTSHSSDILARLSEIQK